MIPNAGRLRYARGMEKDELLSVKQAAEALGLSGRTVLQRLERGHMLGQRVGSQWVITAVEVEVQKRLGRMRPGPKRKPRGQRTQQTP